MLSCHLCWEEPFDFWKLPWEAHWIFVALHFALLFACLRYSLRDSCIYICVYLCTYAYLLSSSSSASWAVPEWNLALILMFTSLVLDPCTLMSIRDVSCGWAGSQAPRSSLCLWCGTVIMSQTLYCEACHFSQWGGWVLPTLCVIQLDRKLLFISITHIFIKNY